MTNLFYSNQRQLHSFHLVKSLSVSKGARSVLLCGSHCLGAFVFFPACSLTGCLPVRNLEFLSPIKPWEAGDNCIGELFIPP